MTKSMKGPSVLSRLSLEALRSADGLGVSDVSSLFEHLYTYNSVPATPQWCERFRDVDAVRRELNLLPGGKLCEMLDGRWVLLRGTAAPDWLTWVKPLGGEELGAMGPDLKIYLSPAVAALPRAVEVLVEALTFSHATSFKVGADARGLLRPDKIIAYFQTMGDLAESVRQLSDRLADVPPHGVPFTAEAFGDGLLSWSVDPVAHRSAPGEAVPSWREWVCLRLARALAAAKTTGNDSKPAWQIALAAIEGEGIDVERWHPKSNAWSSIIGKQ